MTSETTLSKLKGNISYCEKCDTYFTDSCDCNDQQQDFEYKLIKTLKKAFKVEWIDVRGEWELLIEDTDGQQFIISLERF